MTSQAPNRRCLAGNHFKESVGPKLALINETNNLDNRNDTNMNQT